MKQLVFMFALLLVALVAASPPVLLGAMTSELNLSAPGLFEQSKNVQGGADNKFPTSEFAGTNAKMTYAYAAALNGAVTANMTFSPRLAVTTDLAGPAMYAQVQIALLNETIVTSGTVESAGMVGNYSREFAENGRISSNVGGADNKFKRAVSTSSNLSGKGIVIVDRAYNYRV